MQVFERQAPPRNLDGLHDADHAGCLRTRRSTSCNVIVHGSHVIKMKSTTQIPQALSSGESEWYSTAACGALLIGMRNMAIDYGRTLEARLTGGSTAASGIAHRRGAGEVRHIETKTLWLQRLITGRLIVLRQAKGTELSADLGTKHVERKDLEKNLRLLGFVIRSGRSALALRAAL